MKSTARKSAARKTLTVLMWLPPLAVGAMYAVAWNHLPPTTYFGIPGTPERWATRKDYLITTIIFMSGFATLGTSALSYFTKPDFASYLVLGFFYLTESAHFYVNYLIIILNAKGSSGDIAFVLAGSVAAVVAIILVSFLGQHAQNRKSSNHARLQ